MKKITMIILFLLANLSFSHGNKPSQVSRYVNILNNIPVYNQEDLVALNVDYFETNNNNDYTDAPIPYQPSFNFQNPNTIPVSSTNPDDFWSPIFNLPFNFLIYGNNYNQLLIGSNGVLTCDNNATANKIIGGFCPWYFNSTIPNAIFSIRSAIYGVYQDINFTTVPSSNTSTNYYILDTVANVAPNRLFVMDTNEVYQFGGGKPAIGLQSNHMILHETTNVVDINIKRLVPNNEWQGGRGVIGFQNQAGTLATVQVGSNTGNWSVTNDASVRFPPSSASAPANYALKWFQNNVSVGIAATPPYTLLLTPVSTANILYQIPSALIATNGKQSASRIQPLPKKTLTTPKLTKALMTNKFTKSTTTLSSNKPSTAFADCSDRVSVSNVKLTPAKSPTNTYTISGSTGNYVRNCSPTAAVATTTTATCEGVSTAIVVSGTPNSTISYTVNGAVTQTIDIGNSGTVGIPTNIANVPGDYTYTIRNITIAGTPPCSVDITGQQTVLTVRPLPTATIGLTTTSVCENTPATLTFAGTAGDIITYRNGATQSTVTIDSANVATVTTVNLTAETIFRLVKADRPSTSCTQPLSASRTITIDALTTIATQPTSAIKCVNEAVSFSVVATGTNLTYQWQKNNVNIAGANATSSIYTINPILATDAGQYQCVVTGKCNNVNSATATLTVTQPTIIATQTTQTAQTICVGQSININIVATGIGLTYQWKNNGANVTSANTTATTNSLTIAIATTGDAGNYTCVITDSCNNITTSATATVTVNTLPSITSQSATPNSGIVCEAQPFSLSVVATGTNISYQWQRNGTPMAGQVSSTYTVALAQLIDTATYTCVVIGACAPSQTTTPQTIIVNPKPTITTQPIATTTICANQSFALSVTAAGNNLTYQWQKDNVNVSTINAGTTATTKDLIINPAQTTDTGKYTCIVASTGSSCADATSTSATVTVSDNVVISPIATTQTLCEDSAITLTVITSGSTTPTFQWRTDNVIIVGATSTTYIKPNATVSDSGIYTCVIQSGSCPPATTNSCTVTVNPTPTANLTFGSTIAVCINDPSSVKIEGTPTAIVTYNINGGQPQTTTLDASGKVIIPTGNLIQNITYTLLKVETAVAPICSRTYNQSITITVNKKPFVKLEDGYICIDQAGNTTRDYTFETGFDPADYSFIWYKSNVIISGETDENLTVDKTGTFKVKVTNIITGCSNSDSMEVTPSSPPTSANVTINTDYFSQNATVIVTAIPASTDYEYQLDYGPFQDSNVFEGIQNGQHTVQVRDKKVCGEVSDSFTIVDYPKFFTPNGDGFNDTWKIMTLNNQPTAKIYIFDQFGKLLKQIGTTGESWDGTYVGTPLPSDDYWFTIEYTENTVIKEFKAHFSLKR